MVKLVACLAWRNTVRLGVFFYLKRTDRPQSGDSPGTKACELPLLTKCVLVHMMHRISQPADRQPRILPLTPCSLSRTEGMRGMFWRHALPGSLLAYSYGAAGHVRGRYSARSNSSPTSVPRMAGVQSGLVKEFCQKAL